MDNEAWKDFLDEDFNSKEEIYKTRDKVICKCAECKINSYVQVANLKKQVKRIGRHLCWSCSARISALAARAKYEATMLERYGVKNPAQNEELVQKRERTSKLRYGEGGSQKKAREAFKEKRSMKVDKKVS
jgi:hypothetical protein